VTACIAPASVGGSGGSVFAEILSWLEVGCMSALISSLLSLPSVHSCLMCILSDDVSGDGRPDILVSAPDQDVNGLLNPRKVFIFEGANGKLFKA